MIRAANSSFHLGLLAILTSSSCASTGRIDTFAHAANRPSSTTSQSQDIAQDNWQVVGPPQAVGCRTVRIEAASRFHLVDAVGRYVHLGRLSCPGYLTLIIFGTPNCAPCREIVDQAPAWLNQFPNLIFVDVNVGNVDGPQWEVLRDLKLDGKVVPVGVLMGPFGQVLYILKDANEIKLRASKLPNRWHKDVIVGAADATFAETTQTLPVAPIDAPSDAGPTDAQPGTNETTVIGGGSIDAPPGVKASDAP